MKSFFENLFGKKQESPKIKKLPEPVRRNASEHEESELYKKGDVIGGTYLVHGTLGKGGFGVVYLAYDREMKGVCALKTFRDEFLANAAAREAFKKEALLWVNLEEHPFILAARWIEEVSGRLFVKMDYVAPDAYGRASLSDYLARASGPLDADQTLKWSVQFCLGMEHAQTHGIKCHRDIKPSNILINQVGMLKISDFGLAEAAEAAWVAVGLKGGSQVWRRDEENIGFSLVESEGNVRCGTPGYMPPEVYRGEGADIRSDIYSFGLVLWQMAAGSRVPPFLVRYEGDHEAFMRGVYEQQMAGRMPRLDGFLGPVIKRCLYPQAAERFGSFAELRGALEPILQRTTGKKLEVPKVGEKTAAFLTNKGASLNALGRHEEAINCFDQALAIDPREAMAWNNKGTALDTLGRHEGAIYCYDQALAINLRDARVWNNKGTTLYALGRHEEAITCYDQALAIDPRDAPAWFNKGDVLRDLCRRDEAINCYDQALTIDDRLSRAWVHKSNALYRLGRHQEAIGCLEQALKIDPLDAVAWNNKGTVLEALGRREEAISCYDQALAIDPRYAMAWDGKGCALYALGRQEEAISYYNQALAIDPQNAITWTNKGAALDALGRREEAINCYDQALAIDPRDAYAWRNKGRSLSKLGREKEAMGCFEKARRLTLDA